MLAFANFCFICGHFREDQQNNCSKCDTPYVRYEGTMGREISIYYANTTYQGEDIRNFTAHQCPLCMEFVKRDGTCSCDSALSRMASDKVSEKNKIQADIERQAIQEAEQYSYQVRYEKYHEDKEKHKVDVYNYAKTNLCPACGLVIRETFGGFVRCGCNDR